MKEKYRRYVLMDFFFYNLCLTLAVQRWPPFEFPPPPTITRNCKNISQSTCTTRLESSLRFIQRNHMLVKYLTSHFRWSVTNENLYDSDDKQVFFFFRPKSKSRKWQYTGKTQNIYEGKFTGLFLPIKLFFFFFVHYVY